MPYLLIKGVNSMRLTLIAVLMFLASFSNAQEPMKVYVQWAQQQPQDWIETDCQSWSSLPKRPVPIAIGGQDDIQGWIVTVLVMGTALQGWDHYALVPATGDGCEVTVWNDDPTDFPEPWGQVWTFLPAAKDDLLAGAYNTRNWGVVYSDTVNKKRLDLEFHPWGEFIKPEDSAVRHGVWLPDELFADHLLVQSYHSWREWTGGVPVEDVVGGEIKHSSTDHRGHSVTRFLRDGAQANGAHVASDEIEMLSAAGAGETVLESVAAGTDELTTVWTLNEEAGGTWESNATVVFELSVGTTDATGGFLTQGGSDGHAACVNTGLTADTETDTQNEGQFTMDAGIKTATFTTTWSSCNTTDKFEALLAVDCTAAHGNCSLTWIFDSDSQVTVPYPAVGAVIPKRRMIKL